MLKLVELILLVPTTNAVSERSRSMNVVQSQNLSPIIYDSRTSKFLFNCKLKLIEAASMSWFKNEHHFSIKEWIFPQKVY